MGLEQVPEACSMKGRPTQHGEGRNSELSPEKPICPFMHLTVAVQAPARWSPVEVAHQEVWALLYTQKSPTSPKWFSIMLKAVRAMCWFSWSCKASILSTPPSSSIRRHRFSLSESFSAAWGWEREARFWAKARGDAVWPMGLTKAPAPGQAVWASLFLHWHDYLPALDIYVTCT